MEASALTHAHRRGLFSRPTPLLRLQGDDKLVALTRTGNPAAFEALVTRYQARLLGFCRQMLRSTEDAEDVLQEVFVAAYNAMVADERKIAVRPWLYRIARNRCLNHLRRPVPDGQDSMDILPIENGASVHDRVQNREEFRDLLLDVDKLPETQRSALLLREMDAMSYEEIATSMETTVPGVKSLLVRARIALAESSQARQLTCDEVKVELAEAAEGLAKASGAVRRHVRDCEGCKDFRGQLRSDSKALAALLPVGPLVLLKSAILGKLGIGGGGAAGAGAGAGGATAAAGGAAGSAAAGGAAAGGGLTAVGGAAAAGGAATAAGGAGAVGGLGAGAVGLGGAIGTKVGVGMASAVLLAGAVEVKHNVDKQSPPAKPAVEKQVAAIPAPVAPTPTAAATTPADPNAKPADPAKPADQIVPPVPVDPNAAPVDPNAPAAANTTGGVLPTEHAGLKRKHRRKIATTDTKNPGSGATTPAGSSGAVTTDAEPGSEPPAPGTDPASGGSSTGSSLLPPP